MAEPIVKLRRRTTLFLHNDCRGSSWTGVDRETKDQLALDQIGLSRIRNRSTVANKCSHRTTVGDFSLKGPFER